MNTSQILSREALDFVSALAREFKARRRQILQARTNRQAALDQGELPNFLPETAEIRNSSWSIVPPPSDLLDRRVEITGPASNRKMVINALNSRANVYMSDSEDSESPTWENILGGQLNLYDAVRRTISLDSPKKKYRLNERTAVLMYRPRGWHLLERHFLVDGEPIPAALFDFGLYFFHNVRELLAQGTGPYFYLPKLESHQEARLWHDVFAFAEDRLNIPRSSIRATVLIETILAAFEMEEILWELQEYSAGLNCGRWDYIFSFIKKFRSLPGFVLPDRAQVTMDKGFLSAYVIKLIQVCHARGAHAIGGMSAYIPVKNDPEANDEAFAQVRADKEREVQAGHDGTWVAHPGLVSIAKEIFDSKMPEAQQLHVKPSRNIGAQDLLQIPEGEITEEGVRTNIRVGIQYLEAWLSGRGAVPINNLMEDTATAEICRAQLWQWINHGAKTSSGRTITADWIEDLVRSDSYLLGKYQVAGRLFLDLVVQPHFAEFLTLPAYEAVIGKESKKDERSLEGN